MSDAIFDHDKLDVYRLAVEYVADSFAIARSLSGVHRHARDQWLRAGQSIPLNIAEGNGKRSVRDRTRFLEIARGSAFECAAIQDVLVATGGLDSEASRRAKVKLKRIVSMLTRLTMTIQSVDGGPPWREEGVEHEYEHRCAEHEHEYEHERVDDSEGEGTGELPIRSECDP